MIQLTTGNWLAGVTDDGAAQLVWHESDAVFALRYGDDVDPDVDELAPTDRSMRLWTDGAIRLAAAAASLSAPRRIPDVGLLVMRRGGADDRPD